MNEPTTLFAGDKIEWTESLSDYLPSDGWTLKYILINSLNRYTFNSSDENNSHKVSLLNADTSAWALGDYILQSYVEHTDGTIETITRLSIKVEQNLITATTFDFRTHARKTLDAINTAIEGRASQEVLSLQVSTPGGSSKALQYLSMDDMIKAKNYYQSLVDAEITQEKINAGQNAGNKILISFI